MTPNVTEGHEDNETNVLASCNYSDKLASTKERPRSQQPRGRSGSETNRCLLVGRPGGRSRRNAQLVALSSAVASSSWLRSGWSWSAITVRWRGAGSCKRSSQEGA